MSNPILQDILSYLRSEHLETIKSVDITNVNNFIKEIKPNIIEKYNIDEKTFKSYNEHLSAYIKALITLNFCSNNNTPLFNSLFECKNKDEVMAKLANQLPSQYSLAHNICKHIIKEIKLLKKETGEPLNIDSSLEEAITSAKSEKDNISASELHSLISSDKKFSKKLSTLCDEKIYTLIKSTYGSDYSITDALIDEYLTNFYLPYNIDLNEKHKIKKITLLNKEYSEEIITLKQEKCELEIENDTLKNKNELLDKTNLEKDKKLLHYESEIKELKDKLNNKNKDVSFALSFVDLPAISSKNASYSSFTLTNALMIPAMEILENLNLIKNSTYKRNGCDYDSAVAQLVFAIFIKQNSFY